VSESTWTIPPYRVAYSQLCLDGARQLLLRASAKVRFAEIAEVLGGINTRLEWIPLDFGEPLKNFVHLGIKEHIGVLAPVVVKYGVDETRRIVYVPLPFSLLPNSDL
jgi:hypothetical protein